MARRDTAEARARVAPWAYGKRLWHISVPTGHLDGYRSAIANPTGKRPEPRQQQLRGHDRLFQDGRYKRSDTLP